MTEDEHFKNYFNDTRKGILLLCEHVEISIPMMTILINDNSKAMDAIIAYVVNKIL